MNYASRFAKEIDGKKYYLVPQTLWSGNAYLHGFVVTADTPLYYTTGFPQDYVELYKEESGVPSYKPAAYSLALHLAFKLISGSNNVWEVKEMTEAERTMAITDAFFEQHPLSEAAL